MGKRTEIIEQIQSIIARYDTEKVIFSSIDLTGSPLRIRIDRKMLSRQDWQAEDREVLPGTYLIEHIGYPNDYLRHDFGDYDFNGVCVFLDGKDIPIYLLTLGQLSQIRDRLLSVSVNQYDDADCLVKRDNVKQSIGDFDFAARAEDFAIRTGSSAATLRYGIRKTGAKSPRTVHTPEEIAQALLSSVRRWEEDGAPKDGEDIRVSLVREIHQRNGVIRHLHRMDCLVFEPLSCTLTDIYERSLKECVYLDPDSYDCVVDPDGY